MTVTDFIGDTSQNSEMLKLKQKKSSLPLEQHTYFLYSPVGLQMSSENPNSYENPDTQLLLRPRMRAAAAILTARDNQLLVPEKNMMPINTVYSDYMS